MDVLIIGGGGREHALAWKLKQSPRINKLYIAPGNGGTRLLGENVSIEATDIQNLAKFVEEKHIELTIVGPDDPLALGIVDFFIQRGLRIWGPTKSAALIESSKAFSKRLMAEASIPTAEFRVFTAYDDARLYVEKKGVPIVIKASGLALGKGVYVCHTLEEADTALKEIMCDRVYHDSGNEVVVEECLDGPEISIHALSDGDAFVVFPPSQDHKRAHDGDMGPNTGGMGAIAPVPDISEKTMREIEREILGPTLNALQKRGSKFIGLLYPGLKMTSKGKRVLEFNARFGDPETQVYMRLMKTDLLELIEASMDGMLKGKTIEWKKGYAVNIVLASAGYPVSYEKGFVIHGTEDAEKVEGVIVFHAGTKYENRQLVTNGGRVLGVSATGKTLKEALGRAYEAVERIHFKGKQFRKDIGANASRRK